MFKALLIILCAAVQAAGTGVTWMVEVGEAVVNQVDDAFVSITLDAGQLFLWEGDHFAFDTPYLRKAASELTRRRRTLLRVGGTDGDRLYYDVGDSGFLPPGFHGLLNTTHVSSLVDFLASTGLELVFALNGGPLSRGAPAAGGESAPTEAGPWEPSLINAYEFIEYLASAAAAAGVPVYGWELGNEPNLYPAPGNGGEVVTGEALAADFVALRGMLESMPCCRNHRIIGPDVAFQVPLLGEIFSIMERFVAAVCNTSQGLAVVDAISWHWYPLESTATFPPLLSAIDPWRVTQARAVAPRTMDRTRRWQIKIEALAASCAAGPLEAWLGEMALACFGGEEGITDRMASTFWYLDTLGALAAGSHKVTLYLCLRSYLNRSTVPWDQLFFYTCTQVNLRQELIGAYDFNFEKQTAYGLLSTNSSGSVAPNPDFFVSLLHQETMGRRALGVRVVSAKDGDATMSAAAGNFRAYAHCAAGASNDGSSDADDAAILLVNVDGDNEVIVNVGFSGSVASHADSGSWRLLVLTSSNASSPLSGTSLLLNDVRLELNSNGSFILADSILSLAVSVPAFEEIVLPPFSCAVLIAPTALPAGLCTEELLSPVKKVRQARRSENEDCTIPSAAFPAKCDGTSDDTLAIQEAFNVCPSANRRIVFSAGRTCVSQPLVLYSDNVAVHFDDRAVLKAGAKWTDGRPFLSASGLKNISLAGNGVIDGSGEQWWTGSNQEPGRPYLLVIDSCHDVRLRDFRFLNPAAWTTYITGSHIRIDGVSIRSPPYVVAPNTDGFDIAADDVHIKNVDVENGDDSICMKSPSTNVLVENSIVRQGNGLVIGTGTSNSFFRNITFRNCTAEGTKYGCHIKFKDAQSGSVSDVLFENITVMNPRGGLNSGTILINQNGQNMDSEVRSNVTIGNVTFRSIRGVGGVVAGKFICNSGVLECSGITLEDVNISGARDNNCYFENVYGAGTRVSPSSCYPPNVSLSSSWS